MSVIPMSKIKNIIFDLGGVLLNINPLLSLLEFEKLSGIGKDDLLSKFISTRIFEKFDTGSINPAQFGRELCGIMNREVSDSEIERIWNMLILDFPRSSVELLQQLRKNYRVYLLSNTNVIHIQKYTREFYENNGFPMSNLFDQVFYSCEIGIHKPDEGIYTHVLEAANLVPSETLFFDDSLANIKAAQGLGISVIHIHDGHEVSEFFENGFLGGNS